MPDWLDPRIRDGLAARGVDQLYTHQAEAIEHDPGRPGRGRRHAHGVGQDALLRAARPAGDRGGSGRARPVPLSHQGALAGPGRGVRGADARVGPDGQRLHVRRGHAGAHPVGGPHGRPGRRDQPGHAPLGDPAPPHQVVPAVRAGARHRHRRAAHLSRHLRQPRRATSSGACCGSAPTTARIPSSSAARRRSGTRTSSPRCSPAASRCSSIATARRPASATSCSWIRRCWIRRAGARGSAATLAQRWALPFLRAGPADDRLRALAGRRRDPAHRPARGASRELRAALAGARLPRRLPAHGAAGHRARPARRRGPRRRRHERARARRGHRPAGRRDPRGLSGLRSPRPGSRSAAPVGARASASRCSSAAGHPWTST